GVGMRRRVDRSCRPSFPSPGPRPGRTDGRGRTGLHVFTGIVEERGEVLACDPTPVGASLTIRGPSVTRDTRPGDSIAVNGCCLTVVDVDADQGEFTVDVIAETLRRTSLRQARPGGPVNLERSL